MFSWLAKNKVPPMNVAPGDLVQMNYIGKGGRRETVTRPITKAGSYDTIAVGEFTDELGFKEGLVGVIGNE